MRQILLDIPSQKDWDALLPLFHRLKIRYQEQPKAVYNPMPMFDLDAWLQRNQNTVWTADDIAAWENDIQINSCSRRIDISSTQSGKSTD